MIKEIQLQNAAAIIAHAEGNPIEVFRSGWSGWQTSGCCSIQSILENMALGAQYRPKPEPVRCPWSKPEDVPGPVCWIRWGDGNTQHLIGHVCLDGIKNCTGSATIKWSDLHNSTPAEYSTDRKSWRPCTVEEPC